MVLLFSEALVVEPAILAQVMAMVYPKEQVASWEWSTCAENEEDASGRSYQA